MSAIVSSPIIIIATLKWIGPKPKTASKRSSPLLQNQLVLTQGFLGSSSENFTTTLGREGSDYTAAIFASCLNSQELTIWKDVPGLLNADPRLFNNTIQLDNISYAEAIEMTYYGAQVIHPKTLRPLQNKNIPLWVKSFVQPQERGSLVSAEEVEQYPPIFVVKKIKPY